MIIIKKLNAKEGILVKKHALKKKKGLIMYY